MRKRDCDDWYAIVMGSVYSLMLGGIGVFAAASGHPTIGAVSVFGAFLGGVAVGQMWRGE